MAVLERVIQMKQEGVTEPEIIGALKQEGISPLEINEALSQARIKSAIDPNTEGSMGRAGNFDTGRSQFGSMEQSMMQPQENLDYGVQQQGYMEIPEGGFETGEEGEGFQEFQDYSPEQAQGYPEYQPRPTIDIETVNEICEQTVEEKTEKMKKDISSFSKFKEEINFEVQKISERLKKIEDNFSELQMSILKRVGDYGEDIKNISREMHATQESFSKMINPVIDKTRGVHSSGGSGEAGTGETHEPPTHHAHPSHTVHHTSAPHHTTHPAHKQHKPGFESYLR